VSIISEILHGSRSIVNSSRYAIPTDTAVGRNL